VESRKRFIINITFYIIIVALFMVIYRYVLPILTPFLLGFFIALLLRIPIGRIQVKNEMIQKSLPIVFCIGFYLLVFFLLYLFGAQLVIRVIDIVRETPDFYQNRVLPFVENLGKELETAVMPIDSSLATMVGELAGSAVTDLGRFVTTFSAGAVRVIAGGASEIPGMIISVILTIVSTFYFTVDFEKLIDLFSSIVPENKREITLAGIRYTKQAIVAFIKSYSILFLITFAELTVGFWIFKIPYPVGIAFLIAFFDLLPVLGTGGILLPWSVILFVMGNVPLGIGILVLYLIIAVVRNSLESRLVGNRIGLHPMATLIAMIVGLRLVGLAGLVGFPVLLVAAVNMRKSVNHREEASQE